MNVKRTILLRAWITFILFLLFGIVIIGQIVKIQFYEGKYWKKMSDSLTISSSVIEPIRGNIYSSDGKLLVTSLPVYNVLIDFNTLGWTQDSIYLPKIDSLCIKLAYLFKDRSAFQYKEIIEKSRNAKESYFTLKKDIDHSQLMQIKSFPIFRYGRFKGGLIVVEGIKRIYPYNLLAKRTIGYKVKDVKGVGIEGSFNNYLEGQTGRGLMLKISATNKIPLNNETEVEPEDGKDIITTLDVGIQDIAEGALLKCLIDHKAENGCVVIMEVKTGYIKAIANLTKDKNSENYNETFNWALGAATEPGSTFKLASAIVLLETGNVKPTDIIDTKKGKIKFSNRVMRDSDTNGYGMITFQQAFEKSSNVAFSKLVTENFSKSPKRYINGLKKLRITQPQNIQIQGEGKPFFKTPDSMSWGPTTLPWMSVGYELLITPIQLLTLYNSVANNGKMMKPIFVTEIRKTNKVTEKYYPEVLINKICSDQTLEYVKKMLVGVVDTGTARNIKSRLYKIAGKTGTSLIALQGSYQDTINKRKTYRASFAGYFPADNPLYSCIVVVGNPSNDNYYGARVAAPVFKEIADKLYNNNTRFYQPYDKKNYNYENIPIVKYSNINDLVNLSKILGFNVQIRYPISQSEWVSIFPSDQNFILYPKLIKNHTVPDVKGMTLSDAAFLLEKMGLRVNCKGVGKVIQQSFPAGTNIIPNTTISLTLG